MTVAFAIVAPV